MPRHKISEENKKAEVGVTINTALLELMDQFLEDKDYKRSKYIQNLIKNDLKKRGIIIKDEF